MWEAWVGWSQSEAGPGKKYKILIEKELKQKGLEYGSGSVFLACIRPWIVAMVSPSPQNKTKQNKNTQNILELEL
jgi:hypothetical protein